LVVLRGALRDGNGDDKNVLTDFSRISSFKRNGLNIKLEFHTNPLPYKLAKFAFRLSKAQLEPTYEKSGYGWYDEEKKDELKIAGGRYIFFYSHPVETEAPLLPQSKLSMNKNKNKKEGNGNYNNDEPQSPTNAVMVDIDCDTGAAISHDIGSTPTKLKKNKHKNKNRNNYNDKDEVDKKKNSEGELIGFAHFLFTLSGMYVSLSVLYACLYVCLSTVWR
jgi:hypothetical protein